MGLSVSFEERCIGSHLPIRLTGHDTDDYIPGGMNCQLENELRYNCPDRLTWQKSVPTFHPESGAEAAELFGRARGRQQKLFISGFGNNVDPVGPRFADILVMKSDRLNTLLTIEPADFYITVGAGYPLKEINKAITPEGLWFPFGDTNYPGSCGGAVTAGLTGHDGHHPVPLGRSLLALTAVLPDGSIVKPGAVTFKSVSGYDIARLFFNSWGMAGMAIALSFRVLPLSKKDETPPVRLLPLDREAFQNSLAGGSPLSEWCRRIKSAYDPDGVLPLLF